MSRIARVVAVGLPHHITQRGNYQQDVFFGDKDRSRYLSLLQKHSSKYDLSLLGYCLMQNHVHVIAIPGKEDSLAKTFNTAHMCYSQYINKKMQTRGHLWQGRFYSCVLDETHLIAALRYIERNPARAKMVKTPWEWKWSSASVHIGGKAHYSIELQDIFKIIDMDFDSWKRYIHNQEEKSTLDTIREHTQTGRPIGTDLFIERLEARLGRRLVASPRGRPWK